MTRREILPLLRATGCAEEHGEFVFLRDPRWAPAELERLGTLLSSAGGAPGLPRGWLCIPTGGTSGAVRFARHDELTLSAAIGGFVAHFGLERVNAVDVLPPFHVSGLLARLRCAATGGTHVPWDWKRLESGERPSVPAAPGGWVISLVPTQLQRLVRDPGALDWLRRFAVILLGGGPGWPALLGAAARAGLRIALSYGATETAAMIAAQRPEEFLAGDRSCGRPLPHARIALSSDGLVRIAGESVFHGYFPAFSEAREFDSADLGEIDEHGRLRILGRRDAVIITGGEKVNPFEIEAALRATGEFEDVAVIGAPDEEWGQIAVACHPAQARSPDLTRVRQQLEAALPSFKRPKHYLPIEAWPRNAQGKLNREQLRMACEKR